MDKEQPDYLSYLLRLWRVSKAEKACWRASLQSPQTGELQGFSDLDELFDFLRRRVGVKSVVNRVEGEDGES